MTHGDAFWGQLEQEAERQQSEISSKTEAGLNETSQLLTDIHRIMDRIYELIEELEHRNNELEAELSSLTDDD